MQALLPVAGEGTRLKPHTHTWPKALVKVAGKPILQHIIDTLIKYGIKRYIFIVGYLGNKIKKFVKENYSDYDIVFIEQKERKGLGHAVWLAKDYVNEPLLIIYGDTIFETDLREAFKDNYDGVIGVKKVQDPRKYGVVIKKDDLIVKLVEKPDYIKPMEAIVGINYIKDYKSLFDALQYIIDKDIKTKNEYQLTDAFQVMVERGKKLTTFNVPNWFDCGKPDTLLETNRYLLNKSEKEILSEIENSIVIEPCFIGKNCIIKNSIIGPYVSVGDNVTLENSRISDSIINDNAVLKQVALVKSIIGNNVYYEERLKSINIGDDSELRLE